MNRNTKARQRAALKAFSRGQHETTFDILKTMPGGSLATRKFTLAIGHAKRKSKNPKVANKNLSVNGHESSHN